jgi:hypothetical protein
VSFTLASEAQGERRAKLARGYAEPQPSLAIASPNAMAKVQNFWRLCKNFYKKKC